jgi:hypothetical protein
MTLDEAKRLAERPRVHAWTAYACAQAQFDHEFENPYARRSFAQGYIPARGGHGEWVKFFHYTDGSIGFYLPEEILSLSEMKNVSIGLVAMTQGLRSLGFEFWKFKHMPVGERSA